MQKTIVFLSLILSLGAFAQERIELNQSELSVKGSEAVVVRTNRTPETVKIHFQVPMQNSVCERYETRHVYRTSGVYCGYNVSYGRTYGGSGRGRYSRRIIYNYPRTCLVPVTICAAYGSSTHFKRDSMKIKFKDLPALADSESETFNISVQQENYDADNVIYIVSPLETLRQYKVSQKKVLGFGQDTYVVKEE